MPKRIANAKWEGSLTKGGGNISLGSGAWEGPYSARSRFEEAPESNPEELLGAAHAGCFTMALSLILGEAGHEPESLATEAVVHIRQAGGGYEIPTIELTTRGRVPGIAADEFEKHAQTAKDNCPVSKALGGVSEITLDAQLEN